MCLFPAPTGRRVIGVSFPDPEAGAAYRSFAAAIAIASEAKAPAYLRALARSALSAYARALEESDGHRRPLAWSAFIRRAALLYFSVARQREHRADPQWLRAAETLRAIVLENADLMPNSARLDPLAHRDRPPSLGQPNQTRMLASRPQ